MLDFKEVSKEMYPALEKIIVHLEAISVYMRKEVMENFQRHEVRLCQDGVSVIFF